MGGVKWYCMLEQGPGGVSNRRQDELTVEHKVDNGEKTNTKQQHIKCEKSKCKMACKFLKDQAKFSFLVDISILKECSQFRHNNYLYLNPLHLTNNKE